jgi:hypothetical protein
MDIARIIPFPLVVSVTLEPNSSYYFCIMNSYGEDLSQTEVNADVDGLAELELPDYYSRYDGEYRLEVYENTATLDEFGDPILGDLVYIDNLSIYRPYIDVISDLSSPDDIEEASQYESLARSIIDSYTDGFSFVRSVLDTTGNGSDFLPVMSRITKIVKVYENNVLVYDIESTDPDWTNIKEYAISRDRTSIIETASGELNRYQSKPFHGREVGSDSFTTADYPYEAPTKVFPETNWAAFPNGWDYRIVMESGYPVIPQDIQKAAKILYSDLKCGNLQHRNSYIKEYESTNQFKIKIDERAMSGTGNVIVDNILSKYPKMIRGIGVI